MTTSSKTNKKAIKELRKTVHSKKELEQIIREALQGAIIGHYTFRILNKDDIAKEIVEKLSFKKQDLLQRIEGLIADEILIANKEGQPTSRLTSLAVKLEDIKKE